MWNKIAPHRDVHKLEHALNSESVDQDRGSRARRNDFDTPGARDSVLEAAPSLLTAVVEHLADAALLVTALVRHAPREALEGFANHVRGAQAVPERRLVLGLLHVLQVLGVLLR